MAKDFVDVDNDLLKDSKKSRQEIKRGLNTMSLSSSKKLPSSFCNAALTIEKKIELQENNNTSKYHKGDKNAVFRPSTMRCNYGMNKNFNAALLEAVWPCIKSFNVFLDFYLKNMINTLPTIYVDPNSYPQRHQLNPFYSPVTYMKIFITDIEIGYPTRSDSVTYDKSMYPRYCRNSYTSYSSPLYITFNKQVSTERNVFSKRMLCGRIPIMLKSNKCHLEGLTAKELQKNGEDVDDFGGYFIINGNEKIIRYVIQQRSNYPIALKKERFKSRGLFFTEFAISIRCQRYDGTSTTNILFNTEDGECTYRILLNRQEWMCSFLLLIRSTVPNMSTDTFKSRFMEHVIHLPELSAYYFNLLQDFSSREAMFSDIDIWENRYLHQLGRVFWNGVFYYLKPGSRYEDSGKYIIDNYVLPHIENWADKFECLLFMHRKLIAFKNGETPAENIDSFAFQEIVLPGQLYASVLKDSITNCLNKLRMKYFNEIKQQNYYSQSANSVITNNKFFDHATERLAPEISQKINYFMATGNIKTYNLDLQQIAGWTIIADRLNIHRFLSHFRSVHRGQFFVQMKTTEVRKLLGESWGFLCPVHTPDGTPCGLLLHLAKDTIPVTEAPSRSALGRLKLFFKRRGYAVDIEGFTGLPRCNNVSNAHAGYFYVVLDAIPICRIPRNEFKYWISTLRELKNESKEGLKPHMELAPFEHSCGQFEALYIFTFPGRLVRPIMHIETKTVEWIGPLVQPWLSIAVCEKDLELSKKFMRRHRRTFRSEGLSEGLAERSDGKSICGGRKCFLEEQSGKDKSDPQSEESDFAVTEELCENVPMNYEYVELDTTSILSITAALTPFSNHNQSPRNMYQCQMLKQTMGTPFHSVSYRNDNKAYRLITPQTPLVKTEAYRKYNFDDYPSGVNAIVAVISYTGFDMEDAMILNKSAVERGAFHGCVYKTKCFEAAPRGTMEKDVSNYVFKNTNQAGDNICPTLDKDGLPSVGALLTNEALLCRIEDKRMIGDLHRGARTEKYKDDENAYVEKVNFIFPSDFQTERVYKTGINSARVLIKLRSLRNPIVGDKFASRHGQKGILSALWSTEDMPFSESGMVPDILFNPHGFPSRMTIGMLIESMAGKSAAIHGAFQDATPFRSYPKQQKSNNKWIDQCGYQGWKKRGERYMTKEEEDREENDTVVDYFGKALLRSGYEYYGTETLYSGVYGTELTAKIFMGVIYYQRLRHMVSDKAQVRSTGPVDALTHQPVKGRKRHGGVRFGEMERDALISHGTSQLLQDRLLYCSDFHKTYACPICGLILSENFKDCGRNIGGKTTIPFCRICNVPCRLVVIPYVFRYICNELAAMNIAIRLHLSERGEAIKLNHLKNNINLYSNESNNVKCSFEKVSYENKSDSEKETSEKICNKNNIKEKIKLKQEEK